MRRILLCMIPVLLLSTVASAAKVKSKHSTTSDGWMIAFQRGKDIWTANGDGTGQKKVISGGSNPCWAPGKKQLIFVRDSNVWIARNDGSHQKQLTFRWKHDYPVQGNIFLSWNKKYNIITFSHPEFFKVTPAGAVDWADLYGVSLYDLWLTRPKSDPSDYGGFDPLSIKPESKNATLRTNVLDCGTSYHFSKSDHPAWSPSGNILAFCRNGDIWLHILQVEHAAERRMPAICHWDCYRLAAVAVYDAPTWRCSSWNKGVSGLAWSPDSLCLAYSISRQGGSGFDELHVLRLRKNEQGMLTVQSDRKLADNIKYPSFSPDGKWILCRQTIDGHSVWKISIDGKSKKLHIKNAYNPTW